MSHALTEKIAQAIRTRTRLPNFDSRFDLADAYALQHEVTSLVSPAGTDGIKAGVTTAAAQKHFGIDHGLIGSLYSGTRLADEVVLPFIEGRILECEIAVLVDKRGTPTALAPAIEIVHLQFSRQEDLTASNLVLCNLGADKHIVGEFMPWSDAAGDVPIKMRRDADVVNEAHSRDALGGPSSSVPWIWEESGRRGFGRADNTLLMTGSCGRVVPGDPGTYEVDFGPLGQLSFEIAK